MEAKIKLNYGYIDTAARRYIEYLGSKGTQQDYERLLLQVEDADLLAELHEDMMANLMVVLETWSVKGEEHTYKADEEGSYNGMEVTIHLPDNVRDTVASTVQRKATAYCVSYIESRWLQIVGHEMAGVRETESDIHLKAIRSAMTHRRPPVRKKPAHTPVITGYAEGNDTDIKVEFVTNPESDEESSDDI